MYEALDGVGSCAWHQLLVLTCSTVARPFQMRCTLMALSITCRSFTARCKAGSGSDADSIFFWPVSTHLFTQRCKVTDLSPKYKDVWLALRKASACSWAIRTMSFGVSTALGTSATETNQTSSNCGMIWKCAGRVEGPRMGDN